MRIICDGLSRAGISHVTQLDESWEKKDRIRKIGSHMIKGLLSELGQAWENIFDI